MGSMQALGCSCVTALGLERLRYFSRQLLSADDMRVEQEYFREKLRRHNRFLHGWGVVSGLLVVVDAKSGPLALSICPGYALGPCGDEIYVSEPASFDLLPTVQRLAQPSCAHPEAPGALESGSWAIEIRYAECQTRPVRTMPAGCGCDDSACEFSRIRDGFEVRATRKKEVAGEPDPASLCEIEGDVAKYMPPFVARPTSDWIELAAVEVHLSAGGNADPLSPQSIDNSTRRVLYSTAQIQAQLIASCCEM